MNKNQEFNFYREIYDDIWTQNTPPDHQTLRQAKVKYSRAIKCSPKKSAVVYADFGNVYKELNDYPNRLIKLKRALAVESNRHGIIREIGQCLNHLKRYQEALIYIKKALELDPDRIAVHTDLLSTLQLMDKLKDFEAYYEEFLGFHPENKTNSEFYYARAEAFMRLNECPLALKSYKKAVELSPGCHSFRFKYGQALYNEAYYSEALYEFEKVIEIHPGYEVAHTNVALLNYNLGNIREAIEKLEDSIEKNLESYATYSSLIIFKYHLHQTEDVIQPEIEKLKAMPHLYDRQLLKKFYNEDLQRTERKLKETFGDEKAKDFQQRKLNGIKLVLSLLE